MAKKVLKNTGGISKHTKEADTMNACAVKPSLPFVTRKIIESTPASAENKKRVEFMDSHSFSFSVDKETGLLHSKVEKK